MFDQTGRRQPRGDIGDPGDQAISFEVGKNSFFGVDAVLEGEGLLPSPPAGQFPLGETEGHML